MGVADVLYESIHEGLYFSRHVKWFKLLISLHEKSKHFYLPAIWYTTDTLRFLKKVLRNKSYKWGFLLQQNSTASHKTNLHFCFNWYSILIVISIYLSIYIDIYIKIGTYIYINIHIYKWWNGKLGESDKIIKISGKVYKSDTYNWFHNISLFINRTSSDKTFFEFFYFDGGKGYLFWLWLSGYMVEARGHHPHRFDQISDETWYTWRHLASTTNPDSHSQNQ